MLKSTRALLLAALVAPAASADLASVVPPPKFKPVDEVYKLQTGPSVELEAQEFDLAGGVVVASCPAGVWTGSARYYGHDGGDIAYTGMFWRCFPFGQGMARFADGSAHQGLFTSYVLGGSPKLIDAKNVRLAVREGPGNALGVDGKVVAGVFARGVEVAANDPRAILVPGLISELQTRAQVAVGPPPPLFADEGRGGGTVAGALAPTAAGPATPGAAPGGGGWLGTIGKLAVGDVQGALKDQMQQKAAEAMGLGDLNKAINDINAAGKNPGAIPGVAGMFGLPQPPQVPGATPAPAANPLGGLGGLAGGLTGLGGGGGGGIPGLGGMFQGSAEKALKGMAQQKLANALGVGELNAALAGGKLEDPAVLAALLNGGTISQTDLQAIALLKDPNANDAQKAQALQLLLNGGGAAAPAPGAALATPPQIADLGAASPLAAYSAPGAAPTPVASASPLAGYGVAAPAGSGAAARGDGYTGTPAQNTAALMPVPGTTQAGSSDVNTHKLRFHYRSGQPLAPGDLTCVAKKHPDYTKEQVENADRRRVPYAWELDLPPDPKGVGSVWVVSPHDLFRTPVARLDKSQPTHAAEFKWLAGEYWEGDAPGKGSRILLQENGLGRFQYAEFKGKGRDPEFNIQWFIVTDACGVMMGGTHPTYGSEIFQVLLLTTDDAYDFGEGRKWVAEWVHLHGTPQALSGWGSYRAVFMSRIRQVAAAELPETFPPQPRAPFRTPKR